MVNARPDSDKGNLITGSPILKNHGGFGNFGLNNGSRDGVKTSIIIIHVVIEYRVGPFYLFAGQIIAHTLV